jgi:hypothetical protein
LIHRAFTIRNQQVAGSSPAGGSIKSAAYRRSPDSCPSKTHPKPSHNRKVLGFGRDGLFPFPLLREKIVFERESGGFHLGWHLLLVVLQRNVA